MYYIIDETGKYYCYNNFNGKAAMLPANEDGSPPSIALAMDKHLAERKIDYLMNYTDNLSNTPEKKYKGYSFNYFSSLHLKPVENETN